MDFITVKRKQYLPMPMSRVRYTEVVNAGQKWLNEYRIGDVKENEECYLADISRIVEDLVSEDTEPNRRALRRTCIKLVQCNYMDYTKTGASLASVMLDELVKTANPLHALKSDKALVYSGDKSLLLEVKRILVRYFGKELIDPAPKCSSAATVILSVTSTPDKYLSCAIKGAMVGGLGSFLPTLQTSALDNATYEIINLLK